MPFKRRGVVAFEKAFGMLDPDERQPREVWNGRRVRWRGVTGDEGMSGQVALPDAWSSSMNIQPDL